MLLGGNSCVECIEVKCFNDCMYPNKSLECCQYPHMIDTTLEEASVTVTLNPGLTADRINVNLERSSMEHLADLSTCM